MVSNKFLKHFFTTVLISWSSLSCVFKNGRRDQQINHKKKDTSTFTFKLTNPAKNISMKYPEFQNSTTKAGQQGLE